MSQVLSQNEVDALLAGISEGDLESEFENDQFRNEIIPYDLTCQDRIIRGRMPMLEIIHDRFCKNVLPIYEKFTNTKEIDISIRATELIKFGEFLKTLPVPSMMGKFEFSSTLGHGMIVMENKLVIETALRYFQFGNLLSDRSNITGYAYQNKIHKCIKKLYKKIFKELEKSWNAVVSDFKFSLVKDLEINPQFMVIIPYSSVVVLTTYDVEFASPKIGPLSLTICYPYSSIEPIVHILRSGFATPIHNLDTHKKRIKNGLRNVKIDLSILLDKSIVSLNKLTNLTLGDVIATKNKIGDPLDIELNGKKRLEGILNKQRTQLEITKNFTVERYTDDMIFEK